MAQQNQRGWQQIGGDRLLYVPCEEFVTLGRPAA